jgi:hypothetical protein
MWNLEHTISISQLNNKGQGLDSINLKLIWYKKLIAN